ncbi:GspH/FimT family pseudopilin [Aliiglaciecola litoralis]|uniref:GspH/FimT family pseudopilin n=1 Tax=Aliiglaciecola litoralis TaxID=582857 RepID=UPI0031D425C1
MPRTATHISSSNDQHSGGFSLLECMLALSIAGLLAVMSSSHILASLRHHQLKGVLHQSYFLMQTARFEAINQNRNVTVQVNQGNDWCVALNDNGPCDCTVVGACRVDQIEHRISASEFPNVNLPEITMGDDNAVIFDGTRGIAMGNAGSSVFSNGDSEAKLIVSNLGRVRICMQRGSMGAYQRC